LVPPTTVHVERGFSIRNQIKTALKNRMLVDLMSALMLINAETGTFLDKKIARRAAEIWLFEEKQIWLYEIEKEFNELKREKGVLIDSEEEAESDEEWERKTALGIVFAKEELRVILNQNLK
jgi:hypothetical protein